MSELTMPVMFPVGWVGLIGNHVYEIVEVRLKQGRFKKAVRKVLG